MNKPGQTNVYSAVITKKTGRQHWLIFNQDKRSRYFRLVEYYYGTEKECIEHSTRELFIRSRLPSTIEIAICVGCSECLSLN